MDQDNRTPPALLDIAEIHSVTGAKRGHKISSRRAAEAIRPYGSAAAHSPPSCGETDGPQLARLAALLTERFQDPRLEVKCGSAEDLQSHRDDMTVDVIVSGLPFTSLKSDVRGRILREVVQALAPKGVALVLQYTPIIQRQLHRLFPSVKRRISPLNVPPAFLFACSMREPTGTANGGRSQ